MSKNAKQQIKKIQAEAKAKPRSKLVPKVGPPLDVKEHLQAIIGDCLGGPLGDPDIWEHMAAAHAVLALRLLDVNVEKDHEISSLKGDNQWELDFLALAETGTII